MKRRLRCTNRLCESHKNEQYLFNIRLVVDDDGNVAENVEKIGAENFECVFCFSTAEDSYKSRTYRLP